MFSSKRKKRYRDYLEPGAEFRVPGSTERSKKKPRPDRATDANDNENSSGALGLETGEPAASTNQPASTSRGDTLTPEVDESSTEKEDSASDSENSSNFRPENEDVTSIVNLSPRQNLCSASGSEENSEGEPVQEEIGVESSDSDIQDQLDLFAAQTQSEPDSASRKPKTNYVEKYKLNDSIGPVTITKTKFEILVMIFHIVMRHGMTGKFIEDMEKFVNELLGKEYIPVSKYLFHKIFEPNMEIQFHFYCEICEIYLGERESFIKEKITEFACPNCNKNCNVHNLNGTDFFITLPVKPQLESLARKPGIEFLPNQSKCPPNFCDVTDGNLFKELYDESDITMTFNSDGAEAFHTGQYSLWPLQAYVNNLPPSERFRGENVIVFGLWFGKKSPKFSIFLKAFTQEMKILAEEGISVKTKDSENVNRRVFASKCSVDSVARPKVQEGTQYNGRFGCGYCLFPGDLVPSKDGTIKMVRYTAKEQYPLRTDAGMRADMLKAHELDMAGQLRKSKHTCDHVNGMRGLSRLLDLPKFSICRGVVIDYMHGILLGCTCKIVSLLYEFKNDCVVPGKSLSLVDERLLALTPPKDVLIRPRPLSKYVDFKAKEFKPLLLYYILPCTRDVLKDRYFNNLREFATAVFILLKDSISPNELEAADRLLKSFVKEFNSLYGDANMVYNIHLCTHLVMMVKWWGPLWGYSNFCFEAGNGNLLKLNEGTRGVATQLAIKYCMARTIGDAMSKYKVSADVLDFCSDIASLSYSKAEDFGSVKGHGEVFSAANDEERDLLLEAGVEVASHFVYFNRTIRNGIWYYSYAYTKPKVFDDSCVCLNDGRYARIWKIVKLSNTAGLNVMVKPIRIASVYHIAPHIKTCSADTFEPMVLISFDDIKTKSVFLTFDTKAYVCDIPNFYEFH